MANQTIEIYQVNPGTYYTSQYSNHILHPESMIHDADGLIISGLCYDLVSPITIKVNGGEPVVLHAATDIDNIYGYGTTRMGYVIRLDADYNVLWACYLAAAQSMKIVKSSSNVYFIADLHSIFINRQNVYKIKFLSVNNQVLVSKEFQDSSNTYHGRCFLGQLGLDGSLQWHTMLQNIRPLKIASDDEGVVICDVGWQYNAPYFWNGTNYPGWPLNTTFYNGNNDISPAFTDTYTFPESVLLRYLVRYSKTGNFSWALKTSTPIEYPPKLVFDDVAFDTSGNLFVSVYATAAVPTTLVNMSGSIIFTFDGIGTYLLRLDRVTGNYTGKAAYLENIIDAPFRTSITAGYSGVYLLCPMTEPTVPADGTYVATLVNHSDKSQISPPITFQTHGIVSVLYKLSNNFDFVWQKALDAVGIKFGGVNTPGYYLTSNEDTVSFVTRPSQDTWVIDGIIISNTYRHVSLHFSASSGKLQSVLFSRSTSNYGDFMMSYGYNDKAVLATVTTGDDYSSSTMDINTLPDIGNPDFSVAERPVRMLILHYELLLITSIVATTVPAPGLVSKASTVSITATISPIIEGELTLHRSEDLETPIATSSAVNGVAQFDLSLADVTSPSVSLVVKYAGDSKHKGSTTAPLQYTVVDGVNSPLLADRTGMPADGTTAATVSSQIVAPDGSPLSGVEISFLNADTTNLAVPSSATTDASGNVQFTVAGSQLGAFTYAAQVQNAQPKFDVGSIALRFTKAVDLTNSSVTSSKFYVFEGGDSADVTVRLIDVSGNPLEGFPVTLGVAPTGAAIVPASANTAADGTAVFTVSKPLGI